MANIEIKEILKIIEDERVKAQNGLVDAPTSFDQQFFVGKKHALWNIETKILQKLLGAI